MLARAQASHASGSLLPVSCCRTCPSRRQVTLRPTTLMTNTSSRRSGSTRTVSGSASRIWPVVYAIPAPPLVSPGKRSPSAASAPHTMHGSGNVMRRVLDLDLIESLGRDRQNCVEHVVYKRVHEGHASRRRRPGTTIEHADAGGHPGNVFRLPSSAVRRAHQGGDSEPGSSSAPSVKRARASMALGWPCSAARANQLRARPTSRDTPSP